MKFVRKFSMYTPSRLNYSYLESRHIRDFESMLPAHNIVQSDLEAYNKDYLKIYVGNSKLLLKPSTTEQVSSIVKYCASEKLAICPQSGRTGLVGGSVPVHDEIILHLGNFNKILHIDSLAGTVECESGVVLETLNSYCEDFGYIIPLDLGAKGSCMIGGNVSTSAGGIRFLRYGNMHGNVLGVEAVTGKGDILNTIDSSSFDLTQMFVGSEGTLGIVTKTKIALAPKPANKQAALLACESFEKVIELLKLSKSCLSEVLSAFEFMERLCLDIVFDKIPGTKDPFGTVHPFYVLIETSGTSKEHDYMKLEKFIETAMESHIIDGILAQDDTQLGKFWKIRESIGVAATVMGYRFIYDLSLEHKYFYDIVLKVKEIMPEGTCTFGYGHVGDGNLHFSVVLDGLGRDDHEKINEVGSILEPYLFKYLQETKSSISAEHGIGLMKREKLGISRSPTEIQYMGYLKNMFDPSGILNPYKVLPNSS